MKMLSDDVCRCADSECPRKDECLRYIQRESKTAHVRAYTLRFVKGEACDCLIINDEER